MVLYCANELLNGLLTIGNTPYSNHFTRPVRSSSALYRRVSCKVMKHLAQNGSSVQNKTSGKQDILFNTKFVTPWFGLSRKAFFF